PLSGRPHRRLGSTPRGRARRHRGDGQGRELEVTTMPRRRPPNRGGRLSKFTTPTFVALTGAFLEGKSLGDAARAAGIRPSTLYRWLAPARAGDPRFGPLVAVIVQARREGRMRTWFDNPRVAFLMSMS